MRQKGAKSDGGSWEFPEYDVRVGVSFHSDNYAKKQNIDGKKGGDEEHESGETR